MALDYTSATTDKVNIGSGASLDNVNNGTICMWVFMDSVPVSNLELFHKQTGANARVWQVRGGASPPDFFCNFGGSTPVLIESDLTNFTHWATGKWMFLALRYSFTTGVAGDQEILVGDLNNLCAGPSGYTQQQAGSTGGDDSSGDAIIGNHPSGTVCPDGKIATFCMWNALQTVAQIQSHQFQPRPSDNCVAYLHLGFNGTGTPPDWSGNSNNGTVTGTAVADHVPLGPIFGYDDGVALPTAAAVAIVPGRQTLISQAVQHAASW